MLRYTLAFLRKGDRILMINREKNPWRGAWNGIGGKIEAGETPAACVVREIREETGIRGVSPLFRGVVTWNPDGEPPQGMYVFIADVTGSGPATPQHVRVYWNGNRSTGSWTLKITVPFRRCGYS